MRNNRKSARVKLLNRVEVHDAQSKELLGIMVDISSGGFKMLAKNQMDQDQEYLLSIVLPLGNRNKKVVFKADVRWCGKDIDQNWFAAGCYLVQIEPKDRLDIASFILNELMTNDDCHSSNGDYHTTNI